MNVFVFFPIIDPASHSYRDHQELTGFQAGVSVNPDRPWLPFRYPQSVTHLLGYSDTPHLINNDGYLARRLTIWVVRLWTLDMFPTANERIMTLSAYLSSYFRIIGLMVC